MKKNQILALLLAAVMLLAVLTGCAAKTEETAPAAAELSCPRVAGVELDELSLRAAREAP